MNTSNKTIESMDSSEKIQREVSLVEATLIVLGALLGTCTGAKLGGPAGVPAGSLVGAVIGARGAEHFNRFKVELQNSFRN